MSVLTKQKKVLREVHQHIAYLRECDLESARGVADAGNMSKHEAHRIGSAYCLTSEQIKGIEESFNTLLRVLTSVK
jgi:hypothetical protein